MMNTSAPIVRQDSRRDEAGIKELLFNDAYHWSRWVNPVLRYGCLIFLAKPVSQGVIFVTLVEAHR